MRTAAPLARLLCIGFATLGNRAVPCHHTLAIVIISHHCHLHCHHIFAIAIIIIAIITIVICITTIFTNSFTMLGNLPRHRHHHCHLCHWHLLSSLFTTKRTKVMQRLARP